MGTIIKLQNIVKKFYIGEPNELEILHGISLEVEDGEFVAIVGPSGSGKSTLMNMIGALDRPTSGDYFIDGIDVGKADDEELSDIRNQKVGFVFQTYNLIPKVNALKNIELPMLYAGTDRQTRIKRSEELLELVGMSDRAKHLPEELSGGQKQRVAIARAMANDPAIILADEPTGALDSKTGRMVMDIFHKLNKEKHKTIVLITHSEELAEETDRIISLKDGEIVDIRKGSGKSATEKQKEEDEKIINETIKEISDTFDELNASIELEDEKKDSSKEVKIEENKEENVEEKTEENKDDIKEENSEEVSEENKKVQEETNTENNEDGNNTNDNNDDKKEDK